MENESGEGVFVHDTRMKTIMNAQELTNIDDIRRFLEGTQAVVFEVIADKNERYRWLQKTLVRLDYLRLKRADKGIVIRFLQKISGFSRQQLTRLIEQYKRTGQIKRRQKTANGFSKRYSQKDILLLAEMDKQHGTPSGPVLKKLCERAHSLFGDERFENLSRISVSHLYNLRKTEMYCRQRQHFEKTKPKATTIGERRKPQANGQPGYLRVDTVHQGDLDGEKGVYHVNVVDEVTQYQFVATIERISERFLIPVLEELLSAFPFEIKCFHSDNGSEYINHQVAGLLDKLRVEFTKSRARRSNDNALAESKNGAVVRSIFGYQHIAQRFASLLNEFNINHLNPYLNFHRPCFFAKTEINDKGKQIKKYPYALIMTPYEKLKSLPDAESYLKEGVTFEKLDRLAYTQSDTEAAEKMNKARNELFAIIHKQQQKLSA